MRVLAAHVYVSGVVPTLGRVLEKINGAHRKGLALDHRIRTAGRKHGSRNKTQSLEGTTRPQRPRPGRRVVDQVSALQVEPARPEIAHIDSRVLSKPFLDLPVPLLNVLRRGMRIESRES